MKPKVIFVSSFMRSGSTLIGFALQHATGARYLGEVRNIASAEGGSGTCSCGALASSCDYWSSILAATLRQRGPYTKHTRVMSPAVLTLILDVESRYSFLRGAHRVIPGGAASVDAGRACAAIAVAWSETGSAIIDSSHRNLQLVNYRRELGDQLAVLRLVRDPRAVVASLKRRFSMPIDFSAKSWARFNRLSDYLTSSRRLQGPLALLRYEDFCADYNSRMHGLCESFELPVNRAQPFDRCFAIENPHIIGGNDGVVAQKTFCIENDARWLSELSRAEVRRVERLTAPLMKRYGYEPL